MHEKFSIIWGRRQIKNPQLSLYIASACKLLKGMGIKPNDRVAICDENSVEYIILLLALWQIKALAAPVSPRWPDKTVASYVAKINAKHLFRSADIKRMIGFDARHPSPSDQSLKFDLNQEVTILATSGSSGEVKAAVHTWGNHYYSALGSNEIIPLGDADSWLLSLPLYHVSGMAVLGRCLLSGAALSIDTHNDLSTAIESAKITHLSLVSTQLHRLLSNPKDQKRLAELKCILLGGSAIPSALIERSLEQGLNIYLSYGLTEMSSQVATGKLVKGCQSCVKVLPYRQLCISSEGEILVRGEVLFKGYVAGNKLQLPFIDELWFPTGDMGKLDKNGCLTVTGRRDNMFISGGENIHPEEIEKALLGIKGIIEAIVVAKKDNEFGFRPIAFIKCEGDELKSEYLVKCLEAHLPRFKIPTAFYSWPQGLITQGIKISRQEFLRILPHR